MQYYIEEFKKVEENSRIDLNYFRYRLQIYKKLVKITKTKDDLLIIIKSHDNILKKINIISENDITGSHHYYSLDDINNWIRISNNCSDFLKIVLSYTPGSTANLIAKKNKK